MEKYNYELLRVNDGLKKNANKILFIEWDLKTSRYKESHSEPKKGLSLILDPGFSYTWLTTTITEIIENNEKKLHFKTENSEYILKKNKQKNGSNN